MLIEELLEALASPHFRELRNYGDRWGVSHLSFDGESIAEIFDDDLDALLRLWIELCQALEDYSEGGPR